MLDATAMVIENQGAMFAYNPTSSLAELSVTLDRSLGFRADCAGTLTVRATGSSNRGFIPHNLPATKCGSQLNVSLPPTTAMSFEFTKRADADTPSAQACTVFGGVATAHMDWDHKTLIITDAQGPAGEEAEIIIALDETANKQSTPAQQPAVAAFTVDGGSPIAVTADGCSVAQGNAGGGSPCAELLEYNGGAAVRIRGLWAGGAPFKNEIGTMAGFKGGAWSGGFSVPAAAMAQLTARNKSYPIVYDLDPDGNNDADVPWLAPGRLLIFVKYSPLLNDTLNATGSIDGKPLIMRKAYNTIVRSAGRFIGHWADATEHIKPGTAQKLTLTLPNSDSGYHIADGYIYAGNDLGFANLTAADAEKHCSTLPRCAGFSFDKIYPEDQWPFQCHNITGIRKVVFKAATAGRRMNAPRQTVCTGVRDATPVGVFFDNVQPLYGKLLTRCTGNCSHGQQ